MKMLTIEAVTKIWVEKTGGNLWSNKKNTYSVAYSEGGKVYDYKASNLLQLAKKLDIIAECNGILDKVNIYNENLYKRIKDYEEDIKALNPNDPETYDSLGFGGTYEEHKKYLEDELNNCKFLLNSWSLEKEI